MAAKTDAPCCFKRPPEKDMRSSWRLMPLTAMAFRWYLWKRPTRTLSQSLKKCGRSSESGIYADACLKIARSVPLEICLRSGTMSISVRVIVSRRSLIWLPRCPCTTKANVDRISVTSMLERILSLDPMKICRNLETGQYRRSRPETEFGKVLPIEIQRCRFFDIRLKLFKCLSIGDDRYIDPRCGIDTVFLRHPKLDD